MTIHRLPRLLPVALLGLALTDPAAGQAELTAKEARQQLNQAAKLSQVQLKTSLQDATGTILGQLKALGGAVKQAPLTQQGFDSLVQDMSAFQQASLEAMQAQATGMGMRTQQLLQQLAPGEQVPTGFGFGEGGTLDKLRGSTNKLVAKNHAKVSKKLAGVAKTLASKHGQLLTHRLEPPASEVAWVAIPGSSALLPVQPGVDMALAVRLDPQLETGLISMGGTRFPDFAVAARLATLGALPLGPRFDVQKDSERWLINFDDVPARNYAVRAGQVVPQVTGIEQQLLSLSIGLR